MTPVRHIIRKDLRELARQPGARAVAVVVALLLAATVVSAVPAYRARETWKRTATEQVREQWVTQGARHPHSAAHYGIYAFRPLSSTAVLEPGVSAYIGQILPLETHQRAFPTYAPVEDTTSAARLAPLSPALVSLTMLPLIVVLAGFRSISGEREDGNLGKVLATGVHPRQLLFGKLGALACVCAGFVALTLIIDGTGMWLSAGQPSLVRFIGVQSVHAIYGLVWVFLTVAVSARARSSQLALGVLLTLWILNSFVLPRVAASAGRLVVQEPSTAEFRAGIQHDITYRPDGTPWLNDWSKNLIAITLEQYGVSRIEDLPVGYAGVMLKASDAHYEEVFETHFNRLHDLHRRQEEWQHALSILGPLIPARSLGQAFAGTDLAHARHFSDAAERYRRMFVEATNHAIEEQTQGTGWALRVDRAFWEAIPAFQYEPPSPWWAARQHLVSVGVLGVWLIASFLWCVGSHRAIRGV